MDFESRTGVSLDGFFSGFGYVSIKRVRAGDTLMGSLVNINAYYDIGQYLTLHEQ